MKINLVIPAKGSSERLENKNMQPLRGKTLVYRACEKSLNCALVDNVYIDTESKSVLENVGDLVRKGLKIIERHPSLSTNRIGANELMISALHSVDDCDLLLQTHATSPLLSSETIDRCVEEFLSRPNSFDSFFTVTKIQEYFWDETPNPTNFDLVGLPNSFNLPPCYAETHGLYGIFAEKLLQYKTRIGRNPYLIEIPKTEALDIDDAQDLQIAKAMLAQGEF